MAKGVKFTRIYRIISKPKFPWYIISISKICISIIEYRIVTDNLLMKLSVIVLIAKSSLGHHCCLWGFKKQWWAKRKGLNTKNTGLPKFAPLVARTSLGPILCELFMKSFISLHSSIQYFINWSYCIPPSSAPSMLTPPSCLRPCTAWPWCSLFEGLALCHHLGTRARDPSLGAWYLVASWKYVYVRFLLCLERPGA